MTPKTHTPYDQGFIDGLKAYAVWKNGEQFVGNDRMLNECVSDLVNTWNYNPPKDHAPALLEALLSSNHDLHAVSPDENDCMCSQCEFVRKRDAAIRAARGE